MNETLIYLAITRGRNRLVISGSFELYREFIQTSSPGINAVLPGAIIPSPAPLNPMKSDHLLKERITSISRVPLATCLHHPPGFRSFIIAAIFEKGMGVDLC
jgi:hypothetical protein